MDEVSTGPPAPVTTDYRYAPLPEMLLRDPSVGDKAVRVYAVLMRHGLEPGACFPSHARIAEWIGCATRSVQAPLRELETAGWIKRVPRYDTSKQRITDGFHVWTSARRNAGTAQESADGTRKIGAGYRAEERDKGKPLNESHLTNSASARQDAEGKRFLFGTGHIGEQRTMPELDEDENGYLTVQTGRAL